VPYAVIGNARRLIDGLLGYFAISQKFLFLIKPSSAPHAEDVITMGFDVRLSYGKQNEKAECFEDKTWIGSIWSNQLPR